MTVKEAISRLTAELFCASDSPRFEAEQLAAFALGKRRLTPADAYAPFPGKYAENGLPETLEALLKRRLSGEPLQYIIGEWSFMGLDVFVGPEALIPRQDTETLAERALELIRENGYETALDICTGTGCIAIALKVLGGLKSVTASDVSPECCALAAKNAERNGAELEIKTCDLFSGLGKYEVITANPPYIPTGELDALQREVRFEPALALDGGADGLDFYRRIAAEYHEHIAPGGTLLLEVGAGQARSVAALFGRPTEIIKDICGIERVVEVKNAQD